MTSPAKLQSRRLTDIVGGRAFERLRAFFRFCHEAGWIDENPTLRLKNAKVNQTPTMPFNRDQVVSILAACDHYPDGYGQIGQANARRLRALILLLRHSGLRISDAVTLARDRIDRDGRLFLFTAKTGVPVYLPSPDFVVDALAEVEGAHPGYFFWSGVSKTKSAVGDWQRSLRGCFAWRTSRTDTSTGSGIRLQPSCYLQMCRWSGFLFC